jgi:hypothetical protein
MPFSHLSELGQAPSTICPFLLNNASVHCMGARTITTSPRQVLSNPVSTSHFLTYSSPSNDESTKTYQCLALVYDSTQIWHPRSSSRHMSYSSSLCPGPNAAGNEICSRRRLSYHPPTHHPQAIPVPLPLRRVMPLFLSVQLVSRSSIISAVRQVVRQAMHSTVEVSALGECRRWCCEVDLRRCQTCSHTLTRLTDEFDEG